MIFDINHISDMIFNIIENNDQYSIDKLNYLIDKYRQSYIEHEKNINDNLIKYSELYESKRIIQNDSYIQYVNERKGYYDLWCKEKKLTDLHKMLNMSFDFKIIPEIYSYKNFDIGNNKNNKENIKDKEDLQENKELQKENKDNYKKIMKKRDCPDGKILNPKTGRCVSIKNIKNIVI